MSLTTTYDPQNIFAQIIRGDAPAKLYEDDDVLAFRSLPAVLRPHAGDPKRSAACNILDVDSEALAKVIKVVQKLTGPSSPSSEPDGVQVAQFNGAPAGQTVFHIHMHIVPRYAGEGLGIHGQGRSGGAGEAAGAPAATHRHPGLITAPAMSAAGASRPSQQQTGTKVQFVAAGAVPCGHDASHAPRSPYTACLSACSRWLRFGVLLSIAVLPWCARAEALPVLTLSVLQFGTPHWELEHLKRRQLTTPTASN